MATAWSEEISFPCQLTLAEGTAGLSLLRWVSTLFLANSGEKIDVLVLPVGQAAGESALT